MGRIIATVTLEIKGGTVLWRELRVNSVSSASTHIDRWCSEADPHQKKGHLVNTEEMHTVHPQDCIQTSICSKIQDVEIGLVSHNINMHRELKRHSSPRGTLMFTINIVLVITVTTNVTLIDHFCDKSSCKHSDRPKCYAMTP